MIPSSSSPSPQKLAQLLDLSNLCLRLPLSKVQK